MIAEIDDEIDEINENNEIDESPINPIHPIHPIHPIDPINPIANFICAFKKKFVTLRCFSLSGWAQR